MEGAGKNSRQLNAGEMQEVVKNIGTRGGLSGFKSQLCHKLPLRSREMKQKAGK
jgi:hypothetical protein